MVGIAVASCIVSLVALAVAFFFWRRLVRLERQAVPKGSGPEPVLSTFDSVELSLEAMLEELEMRGREVLQKIERRERELRSALLDADAYIRRARQGGGWPEGLAEAGAPAPPLEGRSGPPPGTNEKSEAVHKLADEGHDVLTIAKMLGLGKGEVQLILGLRETPR